jgi:hypothetical protein
VDRCIRRPSGDEFGNGFVPRTDDNCDVIDPGPLKRCENVPQHRKSTDRMQHLRQARLHPLALACRQNDRQTGPHPQPSSRHRGAIRRLAERMPVR